MPNLPHLADGQRENITWFEARDFCALREARLPTEREWEYAARGPDNLVYPWGNDFVRDNVVYGSNSDQTANVGSRPGGVSWIGAMDLSGNVWEWVSSWYAPYPYDETDGRESNNSNNYNSRALRGGSWYSGEYLVRAPNRGGNTPDYTSDLRGFRCARSYQKEEVAASASSTPSPAAIGFTPVARNADWTPFEQDFDGVTMVLVPAGCFMMGSTVFSEEQPVHEQCFDAPFWIDKYEVTQAQFAEFGGQAANNNGFSGDERPREQITWFEAQDFCALREARLPTEREWEYAARGPDNLVFPWGNEFDGTRLNYCDKNCGDEYDYSWADNAVDDGYSGTAPVGSYPNGTSWVGAYDLSGNVWEWVSSWYVSYPYDETDGRENNTSNNYISRVLRGGSWGDDEFSVRAPYRLGYAPDPRNYGGGFRCARS